MSGKEKPAPPISFVQERHGVLARDKAGAVETLDLTEFMDKVRVGDRFNGVFVSAAQARYLAGKLHRMARRIEERFAKGEAK